MPRLNHHSSSGAASHNSRSGAAVASAGGRTCSRQTAVAIASAGATHIDRYEASSDERAWRSTSLDAVHCNRLRRVSSMRTPVRMIASRQ